MSSPVPPEAVPPSSPMRLVDRIREVSSDQRKSIIVPEWAGVELFFNRMTIGDMRAVKDRNPKDDYERNTILLIMKAKDAEGKAVFTMGDKHYLETEADWAVVQRVVGFMFATALPEGEDDKSMIAGKKKEIADSPSDGSVTA